MFLPQVGGNWIPLPVVVFPGGSFFELMGPKPWMKDDAMQSNQVFINRTLKKQQHVLVVLTLALWGQRFIQQPALGH